MDGADVLPQQCGGPPEACAGAIGIRADNPHAATGGTLKPPPRGPHPSRQRWLVIPAVLMCTADTRTTHTHLKCSPFGPAPLLRTAETKRGGDAQPSLGNLDNFNLLMCSCLGNLEHQLRSSHVLRPGCDQRIQFPVLLLSQARVTPTNSSCSCLSLCPGRVGTFLRIRPSHVVLLSWTTCEH